MNSVQEELLGVLQRYREQNALGAQSPTPTWEDDLTSESDPASVPSHEEPTQG